MYYIRDRLGNVLLSFNESTFTDKVKLAKRFNSKLEAQDYIEDHFQYVQTLEVVYCSEEIRVD